MKKTALAFPILAFMTLIIMLGVSSWAAPGTIVPLQEPTGTTNPVTTPTPEEVSWVIVDLPPDATQLEYGAEVYRLVCKACHGDKGQGLTDDWRAQWDPRDQNCWQSKCHALNHPSDGFYMPIAPAVVGPPLMIFDTALDLYNYIRIYMPWHDRGSLTKKDNWSVTAYILKINQVDPGQDLNPQTAALIRLGKSDNSPPSPLAAPTFSPAATRVVPEGPARVASTYWVFTILIGFVVLLIAILIRANRRPVP